MTFALALMAMHAPTLPRDTFTFHCDPVYYADWAGERNGLAGQARVAKVIAARASLTAEPAIAKPGARPYLVRGDEVVIGEARGGFVPIFHPASGYEGCLPVSAVQVLPAPPAPRLADWRGEWTMATKGALLNLTITIRGGELAIKGDAEVQHGVPGNYNFGTFDNGGKPVGAALVTDPHGPCRTRFQLLGRYLVVTDVVEHEACPNYGMGVGFSGVYTR